MAVQNQKVAKGSLAATTTVTTVEANSSAALPTVTPPPSTGLSLSKTYKAPPLTATTLTTTTTSTPATVEASSSPPQIATHAPAHAINSATATSNGGPRVSFNRDVHVKRIGKRNKDLTNYETKYIQPSPAVQPSYHQLPPETLTAESVRKEAALVLAQAERHKSVAENADNIPTFRVRTKRSGEVNPKQFHSLPTRKKKTPYPSLKAVTRSGSDASSKKSINKKPSIFSIFQRKSETSPNSAQQVKRDPRFEGSGGRRLVRSKSDVSSSAAIKLKKLKTNKDATKYNQFGGNKLSQPVNQLTPIIESDTKSDLFEEEPTYKRERRNSEAITDREINESVKGLGLFTSSEQPDGNNLLRGSAISEGIKEKILSLQTKSQENMHSSQLPVEKLPLTKGKTVNGLAKRLSMERFSPPPPLTGPAFSYIRPNDGITYVQLDHNNERRVGDRMGQHLQRREGYETYKPPTRNDYTPDHEYKSADQTDFVMTSQNNQRNRQQQYSPTSYNPHSGTTTIHIGTHSFSPSPWQPLSPSRNLSDEDEGLGVETRKYYDEDLPKINRSSKSSAEPPIVPKIRSRTPTQETDYHHLTGRDGTPPHLVNDLGYRRARLESRILTRRFGEGNGVVHDSYWQTRDNSNERHTQLERDDSTYEQRASSRFHHLSPERELALHQVDGSFKPRFHKPAVAEILNKYSPERSHLDIISPNAVDNKTATILTTATTSSNINQSKALPKYEKTSRYKHTKYYDDGEGGVKEVYQRETQFDAEGKPHIRESRHRERLNSYSGKREVRDSPSPRGERPPLTPLINDYEPKSWDSQFTSTDHYRSSSPENTKRFYDMSGGSGNGGGGGSGGIGDRGERIITPLQSSEDHWYTSSLKRDKMQQRSFDKGDSGIENDFRKESFNGDLKSRWRKRTLEDYMKACDTFLRKERLHCEQERQGLPQQQQPKSTFIYRERSIDDGSHYDPHLDKYPLTQSAPRRRDQQSQTSLATVTPRTDTIPILSAANSSSTTLKRAKKLGGFEKVKQLFTGHGEKKTEPERKSNSSTTSSSAGTQQTAVRAKDKDKYMVNEDEMRLRYQEHRHIGSGSGSGVVHMRPDIHYREPKVMDISMRRRLSTPKASPLTMKRTSPVDKTRKESPLVKTEKTGWFKSLDRRSKSKSKEQLNVMVNGHSEGSSMKRSKPSRVQQPPASGQPTKNLRFFGDTDLDSNPPTLSKANTSNRSRPTLSVSKLGRSQKFSQSAYQLDLIGSNPQTQDYRHTLASGYNSGTKNSTAIASSRQKSTSMYNLEKQDTTDQVDFRKKRHFSRSRELHDISESGSETEDQQKRPNALINGTKSLSRDRLDRVQRNEDHINYRRNNERHNATNGGDSSSSNQHHPRRTMNNSYLAGPPKPARSNERRAMSYSRDRDRFPAESSGTEGESSLHSQRSIVYLHATTVGAIPQPYHLRRRSISKDDVRSQKTKSSLSSNQPQPLQPMTRTVSRSVSMLAPWKPKLISEGYEINYSQHQNKAMTTTLPRHVQKMNGNGSSGNSRNHNNKHNETRTNRSARRHEDEFSLRNSSTTSASKSAVSSSNMRHKHK